MTFTVPKSQASIAQNRFEFQFAGDRRKYSIPLLKFVKPELVLKFDELTETAAFRAIIDEYLPEVFGKFESVDQLEAFLEEWKRQSGIDMGESEASSGS